MAGIKRTTGAPGKGRKYNSKARKIQVGNMTLTPGKDLFELRACDDLLAKGDFAGIKGFLDREGYVHFKGFFARTEISPAVEMVMSYLKKIRCVLDSDYYDGYMNPAEKAVCRKGYTVQMVTGRETSVRDDFDQAEWARIGGSPEVRSIFAGEKLKSLLNRIFARPGEGGASVAVLEEQSWLRLIGERGATQEHADYYYFKNESAFKQLFANFPAENAIAPTVAENGSARPVCEKCAENADSPSADGVCDALRCAVCSRWQHKRCLSAGVQKAVSQKHFATEGEFHCSECAARPFAAYTAWVCLGDAYCPANSLLAVCPRSQTLRDFDVPAFGKQVPRSFGRDRKWEMAAEMTAGDVLIFNIKTIHAASVNCSRRFRLSLDTRFVVKGGQRAE